jgi:HPt (histidine-containing phosphotransfer) domain-containing protein
MVAAPSASERMMTAQAQVARVDIDEGRLGEMLALVGPASEKRLLRALIDDLQTARARLVRAIEQRDPIELRDQTHVLASLSGTFGAMALNAAAQELEAQSQSDVMAADGSLVIARTDGLIAVLSDRLGGPRK